MADSTDRRGFLRLGLAPRSRITSKTDVARVETKASLLPRFLSLRSQGWSPDFIPLNGHDATIDVTDGTALAFAAYWYIATRWRGQKIAEAPLMIVEEDQGTGDEEWLPDHELVPFLEIPNPDFDMTELLERTSKLLDNDAECIWVIDRDNARRVARAMPFPKCDYQVKRTPGRLYGAFEVETGEGKKTFQADQVVYFRDSVEGWGGGGKSYSRLDHAMGWLRLGEKARSTIRDLLANSVWPSLVHLPDATWNPTPEQLKAFQEELNEYGMDGNQGKAIALLGGGNAVQLSARIRDLVPTEVLDRVESVVAAVSGVPAVVLQFQIGLENSPWSNMPTARRMAYDDTIAPAWRKIAGVLTRQVLRLDDEDRTHFVRFDNSDIPALQVDRIEAATVASMMGRQASLNERRSIMGLEPSPDPAANEIPELTTPDPLSLVSGGADDEEGDDEEATEDEKKAKRARRRRTRVAALSIALRNESVGGFEHFANRLLANDANEIEKIVRNNLLDAKAADDRGSKRVLALVHAYLKDTSEPAWAKTSRPLVQQAAERGVAVMAADIGISFNLLHPHVVKFAAEESAWLVKGISGTTRDAVANAIAAGIEAGHSSNEIARAVAESGGFAPSRAKLIARTESTRVGAGGPTKSLASYQKQSGRKFTKTWSTAGDGRVRDEHVAMEGETVGVDEKFSNGLDYPSEPNCRCAPIFNEVTS